MNSEEAVFYADDVVKKHVKAKEEVETLLANDERCRNDDLWLLLQFWQKTQKIKLVIDYNDLHTMVPAETITRVRREIQNKEGKYLPTDADVIIKRKIRQEVIHDYYLGINPSITNAVIMKRFKVQ